MRLGGISVHIKEQLKKAAQEAWHTTALALIRALVFRKISLHGKPLPKKEQPILYLGFHKNGAVDGWVYKIALSRPVEFMVATKLMNNPLARIFFSGIEVTRRDDSGSSASNRHGLQTAVSLLQQGGSLFIFPEGTSTLRHQHLEFMKGAALIASKALTVRSDLIILPLTVYYATPQQWGGIAEVVVGPAITLSDLKEGDKPLNTQAIHQKITLSLETLDPGFASEADQQLANELALLATLDGGLPFSTALNTTRNLIDSNTAKQWRSFKEECTACAKWNNLPLFPHNSAMAQITPFLFSGTTVIAAVLLNPIPVLAGMYAGRRFPDTANVVLLWKSLAGISLFILLSPLTWLILDYCGFKIAWAILLHSLITLLGSKNIEAFKKSAVSLWNALRHKNRYDKFKHVRKAVCDEVIAKHAYS